jgi:hypothetical protein
MPRDGNPKHKYQVCSGEGDGCRRNTVSLEVEETVGAKGAREAAGIV